MQTVLEQIVQRKREEVRKLIPRPSLKKSLRRDKLAVIAEIKRRSPSAGNINTEVDILKQAQAYVDGGASALSILTDGDGFGGSLHDLRDIAALFPNIALLRKDFIIDTVQLEESLRCGATAVLLITCVLKDRLPYFIKRAFDLGLESLVETESEEEIAFALKSGAEIIGVNNRSLHTFEVDISKGERLIKYIPNAVIKVAESGIQTPEHAQAMRKAGYDAVLVGEALMRSPSPSSLIEEMLR